MKLKLLPVMLAFSAITYANTSLLDDNMESSARFGAGLANAGKANGNRLHLTTDLRLNYNGIEQPTYLIVKGYVNVDESASGTDRIDSANLHVNFAQTVSYDSNSRMLGIGLLTMDYTRRLSMGLLHNFQIKAIRIDGAVKKGILFGEASLEGPGIQYAKHAMSNSREREIGTTYESMEEFPGGPTVFYAGASAYGGLTIGDLQKDGTRLRLGRGFEGYLTENDRTTDHYYQADLTQRRSDKKEVSIILKLGNRSLDYKTQDYNKVVYEEEESYGWLVGELKM